MLKKVLTSKSTKFVAKDAKIQNYLSDLCFATSALFSLRPLRLKKLYERSSEKEIMDDFTLDGSALDQTLRELEVINTWLGGNAVSIGGLKKIYKDKYLTKTHPLTIADLGCGGGDMLKLMARWGRREKISLRLTGIDANGYIIQYATNNSDAFPEIRYKVLDIFSDAFRHQKFDIINCTLFAHHFDTETLIKLLKQLRTQTNLAILINDIHRHWVAYYSIKWLTAFFSRSYMVKNDAKISVLRAFRKKELQTIIREAGFSHFSIRWKWAFRWQVIIWAE